MNSDRILWKLSLAVGSFAITAALLIGIGQGSLKIPFLVMACVICSWIYTDWLGWVRLHRYFVYILMIAGSAVAIFDYLNQSSHQQLYSVANLLVYAQLPLLFQEKSRRIFEQIGIFLLLELVVAALVNDNVLYGVLLIPTLTIGAWVLVLHCTYVSVCATGVESISALNWKGKLFRILSVFQSETNQATRPIQLMQDRSNIARPSWMLIGLPLSIAFVTFSGVYFYALPRLSRGAYGATGFGMTSVGFSDTVTLEQIGRMLKNSSPVLRLQLHNANTGEVYRPLEPPYVRGTSLSIYRNDRGSGMWFQGEYTSLSSRNTLLPPIHPDSLSSTTDLIRASISEQSYVGSQAFCIPPCYRASALFDLQFDTDAWEFTSDRLSVNGQPTRRVYEIITKAFTNGLQSPWVPESEAAFPQHDFEDRLEPAPAPYEEINKTQLGFLTDWSASRFSGLIRYRDRIISTQRKESQNVIDNALLLRDHLASSNEFSYTLDLSMKRDYLLDPIEDFVVNQKKGHCQFFAASLTIMLRSMGIPARIVVGYRPGDYNEVGKFFLVRQSHAHAWVEAYFTKEQCDNSLLVKLPADLKNGGWYRLDPTPPGNGSNSGRDLSASNAQTLDFAQQLWRDYIMNVDRSNQPNPANSLSTFSEGLVGEVWERARLATETSFAWLQDLFFHSENWLSWQGAIVATSVATGIILLARILMSLTGLLRRTRGNQINRARLQVSQDFYRRMVKLLEAAGLRREPYQTHREFSLQAIESLIKSRQIAESEIPISMLTDAYYSMRYGGKPNCEPEEWKAINESLSKLEKIVSAKPT